MNQHRHIAALGGLLTAACCLAGTPVGETPAKQAVIARPPPPGLQPPASAIKARLTLASLGESFNATTAAATILVVQGLRVVADMTGLTLIPGGVVRVEVIPRNPNAFPNGHYLLTVSVHDYSNAGRLNAPTGVIAIT